MHTVCAHPLAIIWWRPSGCNSRVLSLCTPLYTGYPSSRVHIAKPAGQPLGSTFGPPPPFTSLVAVPVGSSRDVRGAGGRVCFHSPVCSRLCKTRTKKDRHTLAPSTAVRPQCMTNYVTGLPSCGGVSVDRNLLVYAKFHRPINCPKSDRASSTLGLQGGQPVPIPAC